MIGIYRIENTENGKSYIGQSICIENRLCQHLKSFEKKQDSLNREDETLSATALCLTILELCEKEELDAREQYWINYYDSFENGYNRTTGGQNSPRRTKDESISIALERQRETLAFKKQQKLEKLFSFAKEKMKVGMLLSSVEKKKLTEEFIEAGLRDKKGEKKFGFHFLRKWLIENKICNFKDYRVGKKYLKAHPECGFKERQSVDKVVPYEEVSTL